MSAPFKNIAVVGAGGNVGPFIVKALLEKGFNITVIARSGSQSTFPSSVKVIKGDYTHDFLVEAFKGQDATVLTIGSASLAAQNAVIDAAVTAGVKRIIPSEFGSDIDDPKSLVAVPFYQDKADVDKHLKSAIASHPQTTWTGVVCGPFFDWSLKQGFYGFDLATHTVTLYDRGTTQFDTTTLSTVGAAVASILSRPAHYANQRLYICSFTTSQQEILAALQANNFSAKPQITQTSTAEYIREGNEKIEKGDFSGILNLIFGRTFQEGNGAQYSSVRKISNEELGLEKEDLKTVVGEVMRSDRHVVK
ncbi:hypothetical protein MMC13_005435, partial [Lambiella insularis]|nr:hypothetical protein [Lambiella insularis]